MSEAQIKDYLSGIRRGRDIERQTQRSAIMLAGLIGFALGVMFATIVCLLGFLIA